MLRRIVLCLVPVLTFAPLAAVLDAGAGKPYKMPSAAIARAKDGDTVRVAAGVYVD
jgi:hypothetical protein